MLEGGISETWNAFATGSVLTAWALYLEAEPSVIAALAGLSTSAQILHGPAAFVTERVGRKRAAVVCATMARLVWAPMAVLPLLSMSPPVATALLLAISALSAVLQVLAQNAWSAWMADVVPPTLRGRFFGARTMFVTGGAALASLACAFLLESSAPRDVSLPAIAAMLVITGLLSGRLLAQQIDPFATAPRPPPRIAGYLDALRDKSARGLIAYQLAWGAAVAPGTAFFSLHVLDTLGASFFVIAGHAIVIAITRVLTVRWWGQAVDRWGARPVLVLSSVGISVMPLLWTVCTPDRLWPLAIDAVLSGCMWGGHACASFDLPLTIARPERRSYYLALFATAAGIGFAISVAFAGCLADGLVVRGELPVLFYASAVMRAGCALIAARLHEPDAKGLRAMLREASARRKD